MNSLSIYLFAGDFADVVRRFKEGRPQTYQTHNEVAKLIYDLTATNIGVTFYSFISAVRGDERPLDGFRFVSLGAKDYSTKSLLSTAIAEDESDAIIAHFPNLELLHAIA